MGHAPSVYGGSKIKKTAEKVEGYEDPVKLLEDVVQSGLIERLARDALMGFVGPMALSGDYISHSLELTEHGLAFSDEFEKYLKEKRDEYTGKYVLRLNGWPDSTPRPIGRVCPVSGKGGGIRALANTFLALMKSPHVQTLTLAA